MSAERLYSHLTGDQLLAKLTREMLHLHDSGAGMRLEVHPAAAFAVVAMCQLGMKHPGTLTNQSRHLVEEFIEYTRAKFEPYAPAIAEAISRGNNPEHDVESGTPAAAESERLNGMEAAYNALRGYQYGNSSPDLAEEIADHLEKLLTDAGHPPSLSRPIEIPPSAFGRLTPPLPEELRFFRLIEERQPENPHAAELLTLACTHRIVAKIPPHQEYFYCVQCVNEWDEAERANREEAPPVLPPLKCPKCGYVTPRPFEHVDLYICAGCGETVDGGGPI